MYEEEKRKNDSVIEYEAASFGKRLIAYMIDGFILSLITGLIVGATRHGESFALSTLIGFLYYWYFWTRNDGQSPGKLIMQIRIVKTTGAPLTVNDVLLRFVGYWLSGVFFALGFLWAAWDADHQAWHDKLAGTYVVDVSPEEKKKKYVTV